MTPPGLLDLLASVDVGVPLRAPGEKSRSEVSAP